MYWKRHIRLARAVFAHVLCLFIKAGIDRVVFVPSDQTSGAGILSIHEPSVNARYVLLTDLAGPRVHVPLATTIHFKQVADQLASHARVGLDFPQQAPGSPVFERLRAPLDTGGNLQVHFAIDRRFQFVFAEVFHPGFGVFLTIVVVVHAHPFVQVGGEDLIKSGWQERMLGFEAGECRTNWNGSSGLVVANQIQMIGCTFSSGFNLISLLLGQFEETIGNSQVADPTLFASTARFCEQNLLKPPSTKSTALPDQSLGRQIPNRNRLIPRIAAGPSSHRVQYRHRIPLSLGTVTSNGRPITRAGE